MVNESDFKPLEWRPVVKHTAKEFRDIAWKRLTGRYWWMVLAALVTMALGGGNSSIGINFNWHFDEVDFEQLGTLFSRVPNSQAGLYLLQAVQRVLLPLASIASVYALATFIVGGAVELGYNLYALEFYRRPETPKFETLFARFSIFSRALWLRVLIWIKTLLWSLLFIVPGIIAAYRYAMAPFVLADRPGLTASEALEHSRQLMRGNKWHLFCLDLSFIGWGLLAALVPFGGVLLSPYTRTARTAFYLDLTGRLHPTLNSPAGTPSGEAPSGETRSTASSDAPSDAPEWI